MLKATRTTYAKVLGQGKPNKRPVWLDPRLEEGRGTDVGQVGSNGRVWVIQEHRS